MNIIIGAIFTILLAITSPSHATSEDGIEARLNYTFETLLRELPKMESKDDAKDFISRHLLPITDSKTTARLMLGKHWRKASALQKQRFTEAMTNNLINTYAAVLLDENATKAKFEIVRVVVKTGKKGNKYTVVAKVTVDQQIDVSFKIVEKKGMSWLIVDVTVEGISMVMNWRSTFAELLQHQSLDSVINDLESNNITTKE